MDGWMDGGGAGVGLEGKVLGFFDQSECVRTGGRGLFCWGRVRSQELLLVRECWINH